MLEYCFAFLNTEHCSLLIKTAFRDFKNGKIKRKIDGSDFSLYRVDSLSFYRKQISNFNNSEKKVSKVKSSFFFWI